MSSTDSKYELGWSASKQPETRPAWRSAWKWLMSSHVKTTYTILDGRKLLGEFAPGGHLRDLLQRAYPSDGYNVVDGTVIASNGVKVKGKRPPFGWTIAAFFGVPCRPVAEFREDGRLQYRFSFKQFVFDLIGGWNIVNETITGEAIKQPEPEAIADTEDGSGFREEEVDLYESKKPITLSFSQKRWTEKKIFLGFVLVFKILVIAPFKIITMPFKFALNVVKLVTEVLFPYLTNLLAIAAYVLLSVTRRGDMLKWTGAYDEEMRKISWNPLRLIAGVIVTLVVAAAALVSSVLQYAFLWASRLGLALTSPDKSAQWAFQAGKKFLQNDRWDERTEAYGYNSKFQMVLSYIMGGLGFAISLAMSALLWMITLPLAFGTLTTIFPQIITAFNWVAQLPFVTSTLTWFTQWPVVTSSVALVNSLFGTVGAALATVFGPAVTTLAALIHVQIPATVALVGLTLGLIVTPVASLLSWGAEVLSNRWAMWAEQAPVTAAIAWLKSCRPTAKRTKGLGDYELIDVPSKSPAQKPAEVDPCPKSDDGYEESTVYVYQPVKGEHYIVSDTPLNLVLDKDASEEVTERLLNGIKLKGEAAEEMWSRSYYGKVERNGLLYQGARRATFGEARATREDPAEPHDIYEEPKKSAYMRVRVEH